MIPFNVPPFIGKELKIIKNRSLTIKYVVMVNLQKNVMN